MQFTLCDDLVKKHRINEHERKDLKIIREKKFISGKNCFLFCFKDKSFENDWSVGVGLSYVTLGQVQKTFY